MTAATLSVYDRMADDYAKCIDGAATTTLDGFLSRLPARARVLDLGCGPGAAAERLAAAGHDVLAVDGAAEMVARAAARPGVTAKQALFDDIPTLGTGFDGIWASFSLLHAPRADLPRHLAALHAAAVPGAILALGMKLGSGEGPDRLGRFYAYHSEEELRRHLHDAGFTPDDALTGEERGLAGTVDPWIVLYATA